MVRGFVPEIHPHIPFTPRIINLSLNSRTRQFQQDRNQDEQQAEPVKVMTGHEGRVVPERQRHRGHRFDRAGGVGDEHRAEGKRQQCRGEQREER